MPKPVVVENLAETGPGWNQAVIAEPFVFVSGQVAWDADGRVSGDGIEVQSEAVFDNLERVLTAAGSGIGNVVRVGVYLTDPGDLEAFRLVRDRRLAGVAPASTLVLVAALADPGLRVEVEAIATLGAS